MTIASQVLGAHLIALYLFLGAAEIEGYEVRQRMGNANLRNSLVSFQLLSIELYDLISIEAKRAESHQYQHQQDMVENLYALEFEHKFLDLQTRLGTSKYRQWK